LAEVASDWRIHEAREDRIDADVLRAEFLGELFGQAEKRCLAGGIGGLTDGRTQGGEAGNEDDVAGFFAGHVRLGKLGTVLGGLEIYGECFVPRGLAQAAKGRIPRDPGATDEEMWRVLFEVGF